MITVRLLLAVALGALSQLTTEPLLATAVLATLLLLLAALRVDLPTLLLATHSHRQLTHARLAIVPQTMPARRGRPQPRAPGTRSCASS